MANELITDAELQNLVLRYDNTHEFDLSSALHELQQRRAAEPSPPQALPCSCTTYCMHSGYPDAPIKRGVYCKEARAR